MKDARSLVSNRIPVGAPPLSQKIRPLIQRQSTKLGAVAIRRIDELKTLLNQEVVLPPSADHLLDNLRHQRERIIEEGVKRLHELKMTVKQSHEVLTGALSFALFPDEIIVDRTKVTIIKRRGFWSTSKISIQIEDVLNVSSSVGIVFGSLTIASRVMSTTDHYDVHWLWRQDAIDLKHIIQGYAIAKHSGIDMTDLPRDTMVETLRELGHDSRI